MDVSYLIGGAAWLAVLGYFGWRIWSCQRRLIPVSREITWVVYLLTVPLVLLAWALFPGMSQAASAVVFVVWLVVSGYISYQLNHRFNAWVEEEKKKKKEEREEF